MFNSPAGFNAFSFVGLEPLEQRRLLSAAVFIESELDAFDGLPTELIESEWVIAEQPESIRMNWDDSKAIIASDSTTISGILASFTNVGGNERFTATIDWGDETATQGTIQQMADGTYAVVGSHDYGVKGDFYISVEITAADGSFGYNYHQVLTQADDLTLTIAPQLYSYVSDSAEESYVASFFDREARAESEYVVTIDWGDGTASAGRVVRAWDGSFDVVGDHAYAKAGHYTMSFAVARPGAELSAGGNSQVWNDAFEYWLLEHFACEELMPEDGVTSDGELVFDEGDIVATEDLTSLDPPYSQWINVDLARGPLMQAGGGDTQNEAQPAEQFPAPPLPQDPVESGIASRISSEVFQSDRKITLDGTGNEPVV